MSPEPKHMVFVSYPLWGHVRPMLAIAFSLLPLHPNLHITYLLSASFSGLATIEIKRYDLSPDTLERLHVIHYGDKSTPYLSPPTDVAKHGVEAINNFQSCYPLICRGESVVDSVTGSEVATFTIPLSAVVGDYALSADIPPLLIDIEMSVWKKRKSKYLMCCPIQSSYLDWYIHDRVDHPAMKDVHDDLGKGMDIQATVAKRIDENDTVIHLAALAPIYVYETPGNLPRITYHTIIRRTGELRKQISKIDGIIYYTSPYLGRDGQAAMSSSDTPQYLVGPLSPPHQPASTEGDQSIQTYLDAQPDKSVAYISFGSLFFGITESQAESLIKALAKRSGKTLFITGNSSPDMRSFLERTIGSTPSGERIRLATWTDQLAVLRHPAVAWFLTHAGQGAINESISAGIPMIYWPCGVDQPLISNQLSQVEKLGIELIQIRTGVAIGKPTYRGPTVLGTDEAISAELDDAFGTMDGPELDAFRERVGRVGREFEKDRREGGKAWQGLMEIGRL